MKVLAPSTTPVSTERTHSPTSTSKSHGTIKDGPPFNVYKKLGELVKYLNHNSHYHCSHKTVVLSGVELQLSLLTTTTADNLTKSILDIYPDKHDALTIAGQLKPGQKMRTLGDILDDKSRSVPIRLEKRSCAVNKRETFFNVKYASLGKEWQAISQTLKNLRNEEICP